MRSEVFNFFALYRSFTWFKCHRTVVGSFLEYRKNWITLTYIITATRGFFFKLRNTPNAFEGFTGLLMSSRNDTKRWKFTISFFINKIRVITLISSTFYLFLKSRHESVAVECKMNFLRDFSITVMIFYSEIPLIL